MTTRKEAPQEETPVKFATNAVVALAPVANYLTWLVNTGEQHETCPVVAWVAIVTGHDKNGDAETTIEPALFVRDQVMTLPEIRATYGADSIIVRNG
ncbi:hypothetical protein [Streptomyces sp. NPDC051219]|uniref:hypothetical protein n=1 Tax=Streptomyces sp. NPDC051219 TaxID=3155283 RepID=UPI00341B3100